MPSYIELDKNASVPASSDVSKLILSLNSLGQLVVTNSTGNSSFPITGLFTYPDIDLSSGSYTISGGGVYEIVNASSGALVFPDPTSLTGQTITVINSDGSNNITINNNGFQPYNRGSGSQISNIKTLEQFQFVAIKDKWRGGKFG
jgi:hypothetical protein